MSEILVAKLYQGRPFDGEPYMVNGRKYINVVMPAGNVRRVRVYTRAQYASMYPNDPVHTVFKSQREVLGFANGYITIFRGDTYPHREWFKENGARFTRWFKWSFDSDKEMPTEIPEGLEPIQLNWNLIAADADHLKGDDDIKEIMDAIYYKPSTSEYVGTMGERIEVTLTVTKAITLDGYYGQSIMHIFEDEDGNVFVWTTSAKSIPEGTTVTLRGTIKDHKIYRNTKQTILTRCKEM